MIEPLTAIEIRILGCLVEKQLTTPEYYPLTLNALTAACNQKTNREPVMSLSETEILKAVDKLRDRNLVYLFYGSSSRTVKYKHMIPGYFELDEAGTALLTVLMLRGPQTVGELRERTGRLFEFSGIGEVQKSLDELAARTEPLIVKLERRAGQKEARYAHLLSGKPELGQAVETVAAASDGSSGGDASSLQDEITSLRQEIAELREEFERFRQQFT